MGQDALHESLARVVRAASSAGAALDAMVTTFQSTLAPSGVLLYGVDEEGRLVPSGPSRIHHVPPTERADPCRRAAARVVGTFVHASRTLPRRTFERSAAYRDFYGPGGLAHVMCLRLLTRRHAVPGSYGMLFGRAREDFGEQEIDDVLGVVPVIEALLVGRRRERALDAVIAGLSGDVGLGAVAVFTADGELVHRSRELDVLLGTGAGWRAIEEAMRGARESSVSARGALPRRLPLPATLGLSASLRVAGDGEEPLHVVAVRVERNAEATLAERFALTPAEAAVLSCLGEGQSNAEIAESLEVAPSTVATHVRRVLGKLGVRSRLQAGLLMQREQLRD